MDTLVFSLIWFGLYKLFTADFMPELLARPIWKDASIAVLVILCIALIILGLVAKVGFIMTLILSAIIVSVLAAISMYGFALVLKLIPAVAPAFENAHEYVAVLCFPVFLILLIATIANVPSVIKNIKAIGKKRKMRAKAENIRKNLLNKAWEANEAWKDGSDGLTKYSAEEATEIIKQVREYFTYLCDGYDSARNIVKAAQ